MIVRVDGSDPRVAHYTSMTDVDARLRREAEGGFFMAEGFTVIERAMTSGLTAISAMCSPKWLERVEQLNLGVPTYVADEETLRSITGFSVHRGALAVFRRPDARTVSDVLAGAGLVVILEDLVDHANVGSAFRSAAALGADGLLLSPRCADPLYRRAVKTSMGATLALPWARVAEWPQGLDECVSGGFALWALTPAEDAIDLDSALATVPERVALMVGTEGDGLTDGALQRSDARVRIAMHAGVDSLNVAAASAVAVHAVVSAQRTRRS